MTWGQTTSFAVIFGVQYALKSRLTNHLPIVDLGLSGGFSQVLRFPPPVTSG